MTLKNLFTLSYKLVRDSLKELASNDPLRMAGATAFFCSFALPCIMMIIVRILGLVFNRQVIGRALLEKLNDVVGPQGSGQVLATIRRILALQQSWVATAASFVFLLFVATTLFKVIKSSLNEIWNIQVDHKRGIRQLARSRLHAQVVILSVGLLFLAVLAIDSAQAFLGQHLSQASPRLAVYIDSALNHIFSVVIVSVWFLVIFLYLPDGRPRLSIALAGAFLTSLLFNLGRFVLRWLLVDSGVDELYGTSGSLVLLLLFVFYSSLILYFGAAFTKVWAIHCGHPIAPLPYATKYAVIAADDQSAK